MALVYRAGGASALVLLKAVVSAAIVGLCAVIAGIAAFVASGLSDFRIRAWTVIRGSYLRPSHAAPIRALLARH